MPNPCVENCFSKVWVWRRNFCPWLEAPGLVCVGLLMHGCLPACPYACLAGCQLVYLSCGCPKGVSGLGTSLCLSAYQSICLSVCLPMVHPACLSLPYATRVSKAGGGALAQGGWQSQEGRQVAPWRMPGPQRRCWQCYARRRVHRPRCEGFVSVVRRQEEKRGKRCVALSNG
jgi:hypothetical protein